MKCYLCDGISFKTRPGIVRDNDEIKVIECNQCGLVTLSDFSHISPKHYELGKMHELDNTIEDWLKETDSDDQRRFEMLKSKITGKNLLDFGCGNGGFLNKTKVHTNNSNGIELEERVLKYYEKSDLKIWNSINDVILNSKIRYDIITSFHVFEHLENPIEILKLLIPLMNKDGEIIIEVPSSDDALLTLYNNEPFRNFTYWSQHLFLFNQHTVVDLIKKSGLTLNWVKQIQRYSLSNHLYWLSNGKPGGHKKWNFFNDSRLDIEYASQLASIGKCDTLMFSVSI